jgi:hypothetical protein
MLSLWSIDSNSVLQGNPVVAGEYVSRQVGLEARKVRSERAMDVFEKPGAAVKNYNAELNALQAKAGDAFVEYSKKAFGLGYSEEQAKIYATKRCADWLESEIELLDLQHPFAGNTGLMINASAQTPIFGASSLRVEPNSSMPVDVQQQVPIRGRAPRRSKKTKKGKKGKK